MATALPSINRLIRSFTTSTRLSINPDGASASSFPPNTQKCTIAAGCFWGVERLYRKQFVGKGLLDTKVGFSGGDAKEPSYKKVCTGTTGHAESLQVLYDPEKLSYRQLIEFFFKMHDPTTMNKQGGDVGTQYRSAIFYHDENQKQVAEETKQKVQEKWFKDTKVVTEITPANQFWDAETYHQLYLDKNPDGYECPLHYVRDFPPLD